MTFLKRASEIWRDHVTVGVPASGAHQPSKADIRQHQLTVENFMLSVSGQGGAIFASKALIDASLAYPANTQAWVYGDAISANNGVYAKSGASGAGSWSRVADLPFAVIPLTITGGTADAIQASSGIPAPSTDMAAIFLMSPASDNTDHVTLALNGLTAVALNGFDGASLLGGYLKAGTTVPIVKIGGVYRTLFDARIASLSAASLAAKTAAEAARDAALAAAEDATAAANAGDLINWVPATGPRGGKMALQGSNISLGDDAQMIIGRENLAGWYAALKTKHAALPTYAGAIALFIGDSKPGGTGASAPFLPTDIMNDQAERRGFALAQFGRFFSGGQNSKFANLDLRPTMMAHANWVSTNLVIINVGTNDRSTGATYGAQTLAETEANIKGLIDNIRDTGATPAGRDASTMSILIMGQTTANNTMAPHYQDETHMRELNSLYRRIAREKNCCFIDCYSLFRRAHNDAAWMDTLSAYGNSQVHPGNEFNAALYTLMSDLLFPAGLIAPYVGCREKHAGFDLAADLPNTYPMGSISQRSLTTVPQSFPADGSMTTTRYASGYVVQEIVAANTGHILRRAGNATSNTWGAWSETQNDSGNTGAMTLLNDWIIHAAGYDATAIKKSGRVQFKGAIRPNTSPAGVTTANTVLLQLPTGFRPTTNRFFLCRTGVATTSVIPVDVLTTGDVRIAAAFAGSYLALDQISFDV